MSVVKEYDIEGTHIKIDDSGLSASPEVILRHVATMAKPILARLPVKDAEVSDVTQIAYKTPVDVSGE